MTAAITSYALGCAMLSWFKPRRQSQSESIPAKPSDFVTQILEPTGGKIERPKDWFYAEGHRGPTFMWTISREDSTVQPYITGVRIQVFSGIHQGVGKTAEQFIRDFEDKKRSSGCQIVSTYPETDLGMFRRIGIETVEGEDRIIYSLFWGSSSMDIAAVSIAGTRKELWDTFEPTFKRMGSFEIIDMSRFT